MNKKIQSITGQGIHVLKEFVKNKVYFDLIFIDADKNNYPNYYELSLQLLPANGLMLFDNMLWGGDVADISNTNLQTKIIHKLNKKILNDDRVDFSLLPLADGISFIRKK